MAKKPACYRDPSTGAELLKCKRELIATFPDSVNCVSLVFVMTEGLRWRSKEASYEARKRLLESDLPERIDVRVRRERRRSWEPAEKLRIVQEAFAAGAVAKRVAERYEISTGLLFTWRRQLRKSTAVKFLPVQVADESGTTIAASPARKPNEAAIEIDMPNGARVRVGTGADLNVVRGVLAALVGR